METTPCWVTRPLDNCLLSKLYRAFLTQTQTHRRRTDALLLSRKHTEGGELVQEEDKKSEELVSTLCSHLSVTQTYLYKCVYLWCRNLIYSCCLMTFIIKHTHTLSDVILSRFTAVHLCCKSVPVLLPMFCH